MRLQPDGNCHLFPFGVGNSVMLPGDVQLTSIGSSEIKLISGFSLQEKRPLGQNISQKGKRQKFFSTASQVSSLIRGLPKGSAHIFPTIPNAISTFRVLSDSLPRAIFFLSPPIFPGRVFWPRRGFFLLQLPSL